MTFGQPQIVEREPYLVVGCYATYQGDDEGPGWAGAEERFHRLRGMIRNRKGDWMLGFLYRPSRDDSTVPADVRACFVGVEVMDEGQAPPGLTLTRFPGGTYATVECRGDRPEEAAQGVGEAIAFLDGWLARNGHREGDACFACSHEAAPRPPYIEYVYMKVEPK